MLIAAVSLIIAFAVLAVPVIADRKRISKPIIYGILMVCSPAVCAAGLVAPIFTTAEEFTETFEDVSDTAAALMSAILAVISLAFAVLAVFVYIQGHRFPIDKDSEKYANLSDERLGLIASKRMILVGVIGEVLYLIPLIVMACVTSEMFSAVDRLSEEDGELSGIAFLFMLFLGLIIIALAVILIALAVVVIPESLLISRGCIKFLNMQNKKGSEKSVGIALSLIPLINIIYGICCIKKISDTTE